MYKIFALGRIGLHVIDWSNCSDAEEFIPLGQDKKHSPIETTFLAEASQWYSLDFIYANKRRLGHGTILLLDFLSSLPINTGVMLNPVDFGCGGLTDYQLVAWYKRHGFKNIELGSFNPTLYYIKKN